MKSMVLFVCENYYPAGGDGDYSGTFDSIEEAQTHLDENFDEWSTGWAHLCLVAEKFPIVAKWEHRDYGASWKRKV